jgi:ADP-ribose pyrophosphatase
MVVDVREIFHGRVIRLTVEQVRLPNGAVASLEIAHHPGGAAVA